MPHIHHKVTHGIDPGRRFDITTLPRKTPENHSHAQVSRMASSTLAQPKVRRVLSLAAPEVDLESVSHPEKHWTSEIYR